MLVRLVDREVNGWRSRVDLDDGWAEQDVCAIEIGLLVGSANKDISLTLSNSRNLSSDSCTGDSTWDRNDVKTRDEGDVGSSGNV